ncbi:S8 family peptidase [uncultured Oscillibacter sp.]|uniref:S8 family peptidase n=1 Tax=uncultured Oscillibacter sp. TaxID=876091 RepID=UPI0028048BD4|nr:S8 family peptidase [uncultured Oscillibacter sp.]
MKIFHRARGPLCLVLTLLLLVQAGGLTVSAADPEDGLTPSVPDPAAYTGGEILVLYQDGSCETVACQDNAALAETLAQLSARPDVALVQPNYTYESTALSTSDPLVGEQWALDNDGSFQLEEQENRYPVFDDPFDVPSAPWQWIAPWWMWSAGSSTAGSIQVQAVPGIDIGLADAWRLYDGGSRDVVVALVDTGIDYTHEDLAGRIWTNTDEIPGNGIDDDGNGYVDDVYGWNFYSGTNDVYVGTEDAHGTHGAGTIAANAGNGVGIAGIVQSDHVKVMAVKALGGSDGSGTTASIIQAIQYAEANGAQICNLSLGSSQNDPALYRTIASSKMLFVVAAGNDGTDLETAPSYPASYDLDNLIAVANIRYDGELDPTSSYGAASVDLAAPGSYILSTTPGNTYSYMTGTSMAAPMVSAAAAMVYSAFPKATLADVKDILLASVHKLDSLTGRTATGGMLDLGAAMAGAVTASTGRAWAEPDLTAYTDNPPVISLSLSQWLGRRYLTVQVLDADGDLLRAAYASGTRTAADFQGGNAGNPISLSTWGTATFLVRTGGTYTFYAVDQAGNETVRTVELP